MSHKPVAQNRDIGQENVGFLILLAGFLGLLFSDRMTQLNDYITHHAASFQVPSAAIGMVDKGTIASGTYGVKCLGDREPITSDTLFQIGSITKLMTAVMIMQQVDKGRCTLDDPIKAHLPDFRIASIKHTETVTIRHCLQHQSGISGDFFPDDDPDGPSVMSYIKKMQKLPALYDPGDGPMAYCNAGYVLLGGVLETLSDAPWTEHVQGAIFEPCGMAKPSINAADTLQNGGAIGHMPDSRGELKPALRSGALPQSSAPAGSAICLSINDLMRFARAIMTDGALLPTAIMQQMWTDTVPVPPFSIAGVNEWGLGFMIGRHDTIFQVGHSGTTIGQFAYLRLFPRQEQAIGLLTNGPSKALDQRTYHDFLDRALGSHPAPAHPPAAWRPEPKEFTGHYDSEGISMNVAYEGGTLTLTITDHIFGMADATATLTPYAKNIFDVHTDTPNPIIGDKVSFLEQDPKGRALFARTGVRLLRRSGA